MKLKLNGTAMWAFLNKPETFNGNELGYSIQVKMEEDKLTKLEGVLSQYLFDELDNGCLKSSQVDRSVSPTLPFKELNDGSMTIKAKTKHKIKNKVTGEIINKILPIFDKYGKPLAEGVLVGNGSEVQVACTAKPYVINKKNYGVTLYLDAVLVKNLVEFNNSNDASQYGFDIEENSEVVDSEELEF